MLPYTQGSDVHSCQGLIVQVVSGLAFVHLSRMSGIAANEECDPVANEWVTKTAMTTARSGLAAAATNGRIYVIGGGNPASPPTKSTAFHCPDLPLPRRAWGHAVSPRSGWRGR
ncbi:MAG: hypothetical protein HYY13_00160 [Nitrospirae bacterium]|nr:hypothetical protein [Nitrospirota bacterium]